MRERHKEKALVDGVDFRKQTNALVVPWQPKDTLEHLSKKKCCNFPPLKMVKTKIIKKKNKT